MCSGRSNRPVCSTLARSVLASSGASDAVSTVVAVTRPPKPPPRTIDIFMTVSIAPWRGRTAGAANGSREDADLPPGVADVFLLLAAVAEQLPGHRHGGFGGVQELREGLEALGERHVPDPARLLPGVAARGGGVEEEGRLRDARVDVRRGGVATELFLPS